MVKEIVKDVDVLQQKSEWFEFGKDDHLIQDMMDTAEYYKVNCLGLACIQIGVPKKIIVVQRGRRFEPMINPIIIQKSKETYDIEEGCLSLDEPKKVTRHYRIRVMYHTPNKKPVTENLSGITAQIVQHEVDHLNGKLI